MESEQRIIRLQKALNKMELDGALFVYPIDVYYFTGTRQNSTLWVPTEGNPMLLVRKSYARLLPRVSSKIPGLFRQAGNSPTCSIPRSKE